MPKVLEDIRSRYDKRDLAILVMIDFSKAFDTLQHHLLLQNLEFYYSLRSSAINLIRPNLKNRY